LSQVLFFSHFSTKIPAKPEVLLANREMVLVENLAFFENLLAFWINLVQICKILCAKVVIAVVGEFLAFELVFAIFPLPVDLAPDVEFRRIWYFQKFCNTYFPTAQSLW
jgi:hypothetical protein